MNRVTKFYFLVFLTLALPSFLNAQSIEWLSLDEALEKQKETPKKIIIDLFTDWCGWCKKLDETTFKEATIAEYINANYYAVKFNGEQKSTIEFKGKSYKFVKKGARGYHELAAALTNGRLSYPTIIFLNEEANLIQSIPGFRKPSELETILTYFGADHHKSIPWSSYKATYSTAKMKKIIPANALIKSAQKN